MIYKVFPYVWKRWRLKGTTSGAVAFGKSSSKLIELTCLSGIANFAVSGFVACDYAEKVHVDRGENGPSVYGVLSRMPMVLGRM